MANVFQFNPYDNNKLYSGNIIQSAYYNIIRDKPFGTKIGASVVPNNGGVAVGTYYIPFTVPIDSNFVNSNDYVEVVNDPTGTKEYNGSSTVARVAKIKKQGLYLISSQIYIADTTANNYGYFTVRKLIGSEYRMIGEAAMNFRDSPRVGDRNVSVIDEIAANECIRVDITCYTNTNGNYNLYRINDAGEGTQNYSRLFITPISFYEDTWSGNDKY